MPHKLIHLLCLVWLWIFTGIAVPAQAETLSVYNVQIKPGAEAGSRYFSADLAFTLPARLQESLLQGVPLTLVGEFQAYRERWYWFDEKIAQKRKEWRISFNSLTQKYILNYDGLRLSFEGFDAMMQTVKRVRYWQVVDVEQWQAGKTYYGAYRIFLDLERLPRPLQVGLAPNEWQLDSGWQQIQGL